MKWFRSNIRHGARLALFAMLVQFALTFGHSHWFAQAATLAQATHHQVDGSKDQAAVDRAAVHQQSPASPDREHQGEDNCAICAVVAMAGTILFATPPLLQLPQAIDLLYRTTDAEFLHLKSAGTAFQPRAPPAS
ncbi:MULTISPECIES: DUF2946 domain-containing protein [unclassified Bradyrhizobium]|uniref:DUF2946 domain-containing protein n=1 Tax=unclassified Bradyrhizobium TaxID=2631580 RepID=UPI00211E2FEF|nr:MULTISPECIES: DUF2946 domain-containing protein [unclassified Bradyrhizobium]MDD1532594.1 DUF2946 domain-containing protein [Bradyrhizobium sp. WBOS8]MDD1582598.1 DUF2946 domain-containing protein [Bradyrhizobium sp. WBOS4]UUO50768.1 DUF2946 domain-containing protein [Bradyrhizobium sp. WBOS04]UUO58146.1 DUF2946 domain-containing protein [Bradyrhizobium sp. WBOS08]